MDFALALACAAAVLSSAMAAAAFYALAKGNGGWADTFWTLSIGVAAAVGISMSQPGGLSPRAVLVLALALAWSLRLGLYLLWRTRGAPEDARYADLRKTWGGSHRARLFFFLQIQALVAIPLVAAMMLAARRTGDLDAFDLAGVLLLVAGVIGSGVADLQLARFKSAPVNHGKVCDVGLWALSRHPNYFFEWLCWWAWPVIAFAPWTYPEGLLALLAPALMYLLLVYVSGLPPLEAHMERSRPAAFAAYKARTPAFFPRLPSLRLSRLLPFWRS